MATTNARKQKEVVTETPDVALQQKEQEIAELKAMMLQMQSTILSMQQSQPSQQVQMKPEEFTNIYKYIPVISLFDGMLNLSTGQGGAMGSGKIYTFTKFGESRNIIYNDLREIVSANFNFANQGYFYIADARVVDECGLTQVYENLLSKEKIEHLLDESREHIAEIFESVPETQKKSVVDYIVKNMAEGVVYDLNKVDVISRIYGKNLIELSKDLSFSLSQKGNG